MRARFLTSASTTHHGASGMSVAANISSLAREKSTQRLRASRSIGLSFQRLVGSARRFWNRRSCSASLTENQYLTTTIPLRTSCRSNSRQDRSRAGPPARGRVGQALLEPAFLLGVADREPVLDDDDPAADELPLELRAGPVAGWTASSWSGRPGASGTGVPARRR